MRSGLKGPLLRGILERLSTTLCPRGREPHRCKSRSSTVRFGTGPPVVYQASLYFTGGVGAGQAGTDYLSETSGPQRRENAVSTLNQVRFEGDPLTTVPLPDSREQVGFERHQECTSVLEALGNPGILIHNGASSGMVEAKHWAWYKSPSDRFIGTRFHSSPYPTTASICGETTIESLKDTQEELFLLRHYS